MNIVNDVIVRDSGQRQEFETGSRRDTREGKGRYDLLPAHAIFLVARQLEEGAKKYGERNWEKGQPLSGLWTQHFAICLSIWKDKGMSVTMLRRLGTFLL